MGVELANIQQEIGLHKPTRQDVLTVINAATKARAVALALPPIERNHALMNVIDTLSAIETLFKRQRAELVSQNHICLERLLTIGEWGTEYDALENADRGSSKTDSPVNFRSDKDEAKKRSGDISDKTATRYVSIGKYWDDIHSVANDEIEERELSLSWALRLLANEGLSDDGWLRIFNVWNFQALDTRFGIGHPGNIPGQVNMNLNYYYTEPGDLVVDLFAGGGTTYDVCIYDDDDFGNRRCLAYDIEPTRAQIQRWDVVSDGLPPDVEDAKLIFLDPPYWKQKRDDYSKHKTNMANLDLVEFHDELETIVNKSLENADYVALIIGASQKEHEWIDHSSEIVSRIGLPHQRIIVPYTTQQYGGMHVNRSKEKKYMLNLYRDLMVWRHDMA